jgi:YebC/PmpR family DNA-binding regulatory protein
MFFIDTETVPPAAGVLALADELDDAGALAAVLELLGVLELLELEPHAESASAASRRERSESRFIAQTLDSIAMSGHSKWHSIKHKKAVVDARRGQHFTKLARAITVAAREGGGDPDGNPALSLAIQKARDASMPKDNIERAIAKGTGEGVDAEQFEAVLYEGYGPGGVALLIEALTDNRNRTGADVRHLLSKHGGNLGEPGSVSYLFDKQGVIVVDASRYDEDDLIPAIDAGADDIVLDDDVFEVITEPSTLAVVRAALEQAGVEIESADVNQRPKARVPVGEADAGRLLRLIDALEELDDVGAVHANFDVDASVLERIAG